MTEQERQESIEAFCFLLPWKVKGKSWHACNDPEKEGLRDAAIQALRALRDEGPLNAVDVCENLLHKQWMDLSEQDKIICAWAAAAMEEVIESER